MKIETIILGSYQTNSYVVRKDDSSKDCIVVDTGQQSQPLADFIKDNSLKPLAILLTHGHADHISGIELLRKDCPNIKVYVHPDDAIMLTDSVANLSMLAGTDFTTAPAEFLLEDDCQITIAQITFKVLHTPGHTPGGICLYDQQSKVLFSGDTLFEESIGRTDFPGGDHQKLLQSIKQKLFTLPDDTVVYPGHGCPTKISHEKAYNPFLR